MKVAVEAKGLGLAALVGTGTRRVLDVPCSDRTIGVDVEAIFRAVGDQVGAGIGAVKAGASSGVVITITVRP